MTLLSVLQRREDERPGHEPHDDERPSSKPLTHYSWLSLLRAYGVVLVLCFHFFPWLMPGGFIGVDVFFVFSGYLITSLLIREYKTKGRVALLSFYKRRFRRLFPALLVMVVITLSLALTVPEDFRADIGKQAAAALSWTTNFYEISTGGSYANTLLPHMFVHTWTLSVEMHFYLIWGLALTVLLPLFITTAPGGNKSLARSRVVAAVLAAVLALISFIVMQVMLVGAEDPSAAYYSTFSHAYPIFIGAAIGALAGFGRSRVVVFFERLAPPVALGTVVFSLAGILLMALFVPFENRFVYHGGLLLISLLVALVILVGRGAQETLQNWREPKLLQYLADKSYSLYLFHWPLLIIVLEWARALTGRVEVGANFLYILVALIALVLTFLAAHQSYKYIEKPFSSKSIRNSLSFLNEKSGCANAKPLFSTRKKALLALGSAVVVASMVTLSTAPHKTSIESDYQVGLLEIDLNQAEHAHQVLMRTGLGGAAGSGGAGQGPDLQVIPGTITVVGDSVAIMPASSITSLTGAVVDADVSRAMVNGAAIIEEMDARGTLGEIVVIALATNAHPNSYESAVAICDNIEPDHKLIFVTSYGTNSMENLSEQLRTLPSTYPFVTIANWDYAISGRHNLLASDGYHLNSQEAIDLYVDVVVKAIEEAKNKPTS